MKLLLIGGTRFLGRHLAMAALAAGHELTLFHRGRSNPDLFPQARHVIGDRGSDLHRLSGGPWDAAIDTCAYVPRDVLRLAEALAGRVGRYLLVSTISAYRDPGADSIDEDSPLQELADPTVETVTGETYGGLKVLCEQAALQGFGASSTLIARPGLIVGPHDPTERFTWWLRRLHRGGTVVAPGPADAPVQFIDARDAADWLLRRAEAGTRGVFNLCGPTQPLTWGRWLQGLVQALGADARLRWIDEPALLQAGVRPWVDLPLWLPVADAGLHRVSMTRALATGLHTRAVEDTARDTLAWALTTAQPPGDGPGLDPGLEQQLLAADPRD